MSACPLRAGPPDCRNLKLGKRIDYAVFVPVHALEVRIVGTLESLLGRQGFHVLDGCAAEYCSRLPRCQPKIHGWYAERHKATLWKHRHYRQASRRALIRHRSQVSAANGTSHNNTTQQILSAFLLVPAPLYL